MHFDSFLHNMEDTGPLHGHSQTIISVHADLMFYM